MEAPSEIPRLDKQTRKGMAIVVLYPVIVALVSVAANLFLFSVEPVVLAPPSVDVVRALVISGVVLVVNHTWLMTATELTRARFGLFATPEERAAHANNANNAQDPSPEGPQAGRRRHNAHRNATENTAVFVLLALVFALTSPSSIAAYVWLVGFAVARFGHALAYLARSTSIRGLFMTVSLLAMYGLASHTALALLFD